jgi:hypothetical protein
LLSLAVLVLAVHQVKAMAVAVAALVDIKHLLVALL